MPPTSAENFQVFFSGVLLGILIGYICNARYFMPRINWYYVGNFVFAFLVGFFLSYLYSLIVGGVIEDVLALVRSFAKHSICAIDDGEDNDCLFRIACFQNCFPILISFCILSLYQEKCSWNFIAGSNHPRSFFKLFLFSVLSKQYYIIPVFLISAKSTMAPSSLSLRVLPC